MEPTGNSPDSSDRKTGKKIVASSATVKPNGKSISSSAIAKTDVSSPVPVKPNVATDLSSVHADQVMLFRDVSFGPREAELRFRLIHFWEARNPLTKTLIGQEMLLIDEELNNFFGSRSKVQYRVADHIATVSFTWNSDLAVLDNPPVPFPEDRFRFHGYEEFRANCDSKGDLYDYVGHMKLVNGQTISDHIVLDEVDISEKWHICVHVQTHDGPVMKLYIWDKAASDFCQKFKSYGGTPIVLLVTTVNPKHLGAGTLALTTMSSSRVFMDADVQPSKDYLEWLSSNSDIANRVAAEVVTKPETVTLGEIFSYIKQEGSKVAWFECTATIDDVVQGSAWYYISCGGCNSKAVKGPTSLTCNSKKCGKREVTGVAQYLTKISVYDESEQAVFVVLGDAGKELTGKHASALVVSYFEKRRFVVKVSDHNLTGKTQTLTVTKILPPEAPQPIEHLEEKANPSRGFEDAAGDMVRKASERLESGEAKRPKSG
ncbi:hypothetical protein Bca52824_077277 [Brassica carinata]|uniref:Replication factor A C-terminal domain-containing protein n=1 Tax=Brassica carinata TaxID=52824 RepID=A0A8X7PVK5_BRACI|nr:hypothetical protein Bca52824_077277 [Brassica carinata]